MRYRFIMFLILCNFSLVTAQDHNALLNKLDGNLSLIEKVEVLNQLCEHYRTTNANNVKLYAEELISLANEDSSSFAFGWGSYYMGDYFYITNAYDESIKHFELALIAFNTSANAEGIGKAASSMAIVYFHQDRHRNALNYAEIALEAQYETGSLLEQSNTLALICDIYAYMESYNQAIQYCVQSMKIKEDIKTEKNKEITLNTIGFIYQELGSYQKASEYLYQALALANKNQDPYHIATTYSNLGNLYILLNKTDSALRFFNLALETDSLAEDHVGLAFSYYDVGSVHYKNKNYKKAIAYFTRSQQLANEQDMPDLIANNNIALGEIYTAQKQYNKAIIELKKGLVIAQRINSTTNLKDAYQNLSKLYDAQGDKDNALIYMRLYLLIAERKFKKDNTKAIAEVETIYKIGKKEQELDLLKKEKAIDDLRAKNRQFYLLAAGIGIILLIILIIILFSRNNLKNRTNKKLQSQNNEILEQKEEIQSQKEELEVTSRALATNNKQITDSINYARQIQESLLPENGLLKKQFPKSFIYYKPKDIVSGDFYWHAEVEGKIAVAVIDCTGHGVPGAFMTVLANSLLNQIILETGIYSPDLVITLLDQKIQQALHQHNMGYSSMEGLDIGLLVIDKKKKRAEFAGAKISLYQVINRQLTKITADRYSVGSNQNLDKVFNIKEVKLDKTGMLYLSTDGYQDQFGGPNDKKFMKKSFYDYLTSISHLPPGEQEHSLEKRFQQWRGRNTQTDDILVIGISI